MYVRIHMLSNVILLLWLSLSPWGARRPRDASSLEGPQLDRPRPRLITITATILLLLLLLLLTNINNNNNNNNNDNNHI